MAKCCQKSKSNRNVTTTSWYIRLVLLPIIVYRYAISPLLGPRCRFEPSCSLYTQQALQQYGLIKGCALAVKRLSKCHPWHPGGADPIPEQHH